MFFKIFAGADASTLKIFWKATNPINSNLKLNGYLKLVKMIVWLDI